MTDSGYQNPISWPPSGNTASIQDRSLSSESTQCPDACLRATRFTSGTVLITLQNWQERRTPAWKLWTVESEMKYYFKCLQMPAGYRWQQKVLGLPPAATCFCRCMLQERYGQKQSWIKWQEHPVRQKFTNAILLLTGKNGCNICYRKTYLRRRHDGQQN